MTVRTGDRQSGDRENLSTDLLVEISDTGIGIDSDAIHRIFASADLGGNSTTRRFGGLGLGLTLSRSIVLQHGGELSAASAGAGLGATFTVLMPTAPAPAR